MLKFASQSSAEATGIRRVARGNVTISDDGPDDTHDRKSDVTSPKRHSESLEAPQTEATARRNSRKSEA
jgi:hypothetical protein